VNNAAHEGRFPTIHPSCELLSFLRRRVALLEIGLAAFFNHTLIISHDLRHTAILGTPQTLIVNHVKLGISTPKHKRLHKRFLLSLSRYLLE
jgi:hypothetical protein